MKAYRTTMLGLMAAAVLTSCGGGGGGGGGASVEEESGIEAFSVAAGQAQTISFAGGGGELALPATAVAEPLSMEVAVDEEMPEGGMSPAYRLSPETYELASPSTLSIAVPESAQNGARFVIARQEGDSWRPLLSSFRNGDRIEASITELGAYMLTEVPALVASKSIGPACTEVAEQELRFTHVADLHARYGTADQLYSRIRYFQDQALLENPYTVLTNGGDDFEKGSVAEQLSQGVATVEATQAMGFDVRVVGNHDFAWGSDILLDYSKDERAEVISSNTLYRGSEEGFAAKDIVALQVGCLKVGFFGMTSTPWNEFDEPLEEDPIPDFLPDVEMNWHWQQIARGAVYQYSDQVDVLVMLSHLGKGLDEEIAQQTPGIDLVLGGHSHGGVSTSVSGDAIVVQPDFYADGLSDIRLRYSLTTGQRLDYSVTNVEVRDVPGVDATVAAAIDDVMQRHAPEARAEISISENYLTTDEIIDVAARAALFHHNADAVLMAPNGVNDFDRWLPGTLTQESFHRAISVERQPADTPGFTGFYAVTVSFAELQQMLSAQPDWRTAMREGLSDAAPIKVVLQKAPALNISTFFPGLSDRSAEFLSEAWESLDTYARHRTSQCLHIDTDTRLYSCDPDTLTTVWQFSEGSTPFAASLGGSELSFFSPSGGTGSADISSFGTATDFGIAPLPDGDSVLLSFGAYAFDEGVELRRNVANNGDYAEQGLLSDYTLVFDVFWPTASHGKYRAVLQTNVANDDDADIFFDNSTEGRLGIATSGLSYFGEFQPETWHRVALVFYAGNTEGSLKIYHNGELVGEKRDGDTDARWAMSEVALLLTDNSNETEAGYLNALLFAGRPYTDDEIKALGGPSRQLLPSQDTQSVQARIRRHMGDGY
ncbi:MAG: metallophosphoesterase [Spongiibacter sp.]|nr:metallophosphoesterase [Spongiibacter sp.]